MDRKQILELALQALQQQRSQIEVEIETLRAELKGTEPAAQKRISVPSTSLRRRRRTPAERKAQSLKMRESWAARRAKAGKPAPSAKGPSSRIKTDAEKRAISLKMKESWKKRKAAKKADTKPAAV